LSYRHQTTAEIGNYPYIKQYIKRHFNTFTGVTLEQMFIEQLIERHEFTQIRAIRRFLFSIPAHHDKRSTVNLRAP